tara:strand:+ start:110 stop:412 length:303 start_codon:yes stop_codon:yes gene_type:complete
MKRAELEQLRRVIDDARVVADEDGADLENLVGALAILDAELAKPEAREWGVQFIDKRGLEDRVLQFDEEYARRFADGETCILFSRSAKFLTPAGQWECAE